MARVTLIARFSALPGHREDAAELITEYADHVRAADGCIVFEPTTSADRPLEFVVLEQYRDADAFAAHLADPENTRFNARLAPFVEGGSQLEMLDRVGPRPHREPRRETSVPA